MRKIVLTFGLIAGSILAAMMWLTLPFLERISFEKGAILGYTSMVLAFLMVFFGVRSYRENVGRGRVTFGRALVVGLLITAIASACYVLSWEVMSHQFMPDFADKYAARAIEEAKASGATQSEVAEQVRKMSEFKEMYKNPVINVALTLIEPLPVGILFALVAAGTLSRKRPQAGGSAPAMKGA